MYIRHLSAVLVSMFSLSLSLKLNRSALNKRAYSMKHGGIQSEVIHSKYDKIQSTKIVEYGVEAILYKHKKSGASVLSIIAPQDENKVFGITFRTPPTDSTGIPHILEHSVLCGSRKYPVKEPFVDLMRGSLQTFLNAFTYPDRTCYPVASMNTKDFYNLINVYLDAVLHPKCIENDMVLKQEGWHYELENPTDPLSLKGVVYNEMKGVYSSPDSIMGTETQLALFPDNTYGVDSGGNPRDIPNLTFKQFKEFHSSYYHPANSRIYFYGDDDPVKRLELLDEYLRDFDAIPVNSHIQYQKKIETPKKIQVEFPVQEDTTPKHMLTVNWVLNHKELPPKENLAISVLNHLLLATPSSPLRKILTESQLGESVTGGGLSDELLQATFSVGLKGVSQDNCDKVEQLVLSTLKDLSKTGFDEMDIKASLNTIEFSLREFNTGSFPRGLSLMLGILGQWIYDKDPFEGVRFENALAELKADLKAGKPIFQELLDKYFVQNSHRVTVEMKPNDKLESMALAAEEEKLKKIKSSMSPSELESIVKETSKLQAMQAAEDSVEAKNTIPKLGMEDLDPTAKDIPIEVIKRGSESGAILTHDLVTSGILYADIGFDLSGVSQEDLPLLPLFARLVKEAGTKKFDEVALSRRIGSTTGGVSTSFYTDLKHTPGKVSQPDDALFYFMVRGKAVKDNIPELFDIFQDILFNANLKENKKRALEILKETKVRSETSIISNGHSFAATRLAAPNSLQGYFSEMTGGLTYVRSLGELIQQAESDWEGFGKRLDRMRDSIVRRSGYVINLTADKSTTDSALTSVNSFLDSLPPGATPTNGKPYSGWDRSVFKSQTNEGFSMPSQVNYVVKGASVLKPGDEVNGAYSVVSSFLSKGLLWNKVRVMGGAYGGFARFGESSGQFTFLSYRDPNLSKTLDVYDSAPEFLKTTEISDEDILQTIIGCTGDLDTPMTADQKGYASMVRYLNGETFKDRQTYRNEVLNTKIEDFRKFADKLSAIQTDGRTVVFGSESALKQANEVLPKDKLLTISRAI